MTARARQFDADPMRVRAPKRGPGPAVAAMLARPATATLARTDDEDAQACLPGLEASVEGQDADAPECSLVGADAAPSDETLLEPGQDGSVPEPQDATRTVAAGDLASFLLPGATCAPLLDPGAPIEWAPVEGDAFGAGLKGIVEVGGQALGEGTVSGAVGTATGMTGEIVTGVVITDTALTVAPIPLVVAGVIVVGGVTYLIVTGRLQAHVDDGGDREPADASSCSSLSCSMSVSIAARERSRPHSLLRPADAICDVAGGGRTRPRSCEEPDVLRHSMCHPGRQVTSAVAPLKSRCNPSGGPWGPTLPPQEPAMHSTTRIIAAAISAERRRPTARVRLHRPPRRLRPGRPWVATRPRLSSPRLAPTSPTPPTSSCTDLDEQCPWPPRQPVLLLASPPLHTTAPARATEAGDDRGHRTLDA